MNGAAARLLGVLGGAILFSTQASVAADALRCGHSLLHLGDSRYEVRSACGEPDDRQTRTEYRSVTRKVRTPCGPSNEGNCSSVRSKTEEIVIEEWLYDFGRLKFIQHLVFEQGRLVRVTQGDRGRKD